MFILKKLLATFFALMLASSPQQVQVDEPEPTPVSCEFYFNSWEEAKKADPPARAMYWLLDDSEYLLFVTSETTALHEVGHIVDNTKEISSTTEFQTAVDTYIDSKLGDDDWVYYRLTFLFVMGEGYQDVYAELYMINILHENDLPDIFARFFDVQ